jgi:glyoxylase-like metal-dependent hydrolase (beta-lactamase superfamily II)
MQLHVINTGLFKLDGGAMFGVVPKSMWHKNYPADENNMCTWEMRCLLVQDGNRLILIDTGIGQKQDDKFFSHFYLHGNDSLLQSIKNCGYAPEDITDVLLTHLHFDHCGGAIQNKNDQLVPTFPNATYWSNEQHWLTATQPNAREKASFLKENILPIQESGQLKFMVAEDGISFSDHIKLRFVHGHTEAMMLPLIDYKGKNILFCADLFPSHLHVPLPWVMAYDMQPLLTMKEKEIIYQDALKNEYVLFFEHDSLTECATIINTDRGIKIQEKFTLKNIL